MSICHLLYSIDLKVSDVETISYYRRKPARMSAIEYTNDKKKLIRPQGVLY